jgi:hypothetical protein
VHGCGLSVRVEGCCTTVALSCIRYIPSYCNDLFESNFSKPRIAYCMLVNCADVLFTGYLS